MGSWPNRPAWVREEVPLAGMTTWGIGGSAEFFAEPREVVALAETLRAAEARGLPLYTLGGGSNLLIGDGILAGLVLRLGRGGFDKVLEVDVKRGELVVGAGLSLPRLISIATENGLAGLEDLAGIPGTVGGAVVMNAGNPVRGIGASVHSITACERSGRIVTIPEERLQFAYRWSNLHDLILTSVHLRLQPDEKEAISERVSSFRVQKEERHPVGERSAGCVFRNPAKAPAGMLIDRAGLKGLTIGGAMVSVKHANFIVNRGGATCDDVQALITEIKRVVRERFNEELALEVSLWI